MFAVCRSLLKSTWADSYLPAHMVQGVQELASQRKSGQTRVPAVFLINLDGSDQRLAEATAQLNASAIPFQRVSAFDGRNLNTDTFAGCDTRRFLRLMGRPIRGGEIGCYLSHLDAARQFLASDARFGLVLEDDFRFLPGTWRLICELTAWAAARPVDWDVINLGHKKHKIFSPIQHLSTTGVSTTVTRAHYFPMTASALLWSIEGATAFVNEHDRIFAPVDNFLRHWQTRRDRGLAVWPPIVSTTDAQSQIDSAATKRSRKGRSALYRLIKQRRLWVDKALAFRHLLRFRTGI